MDISKFSKGMQKAIANAVVYLVKHPDASAYAVANETGVTYYIARKLIRERQTPIENLIPKADPPGAKLLKEAAATFEQRGKTYGPAAGHWREVAALWTTISGKDITPDMAVRMMIGLKLMRMKETPGHHDSVVDVVGYAAVLAEVQAMMEEQ